MTKRNTLAAFAGLCACMCWAFTTAMAENPSAVRAAPSRKGMTNNGGKPFVRGTSVVNDKSQPVDTRDLSFNQGDIQPIEVKALPVNPSPVGSDHLDAGVRGTPPPCAFLPCDDIYLNEGVTGIFGFGDPDGVPSCDDVSMAGTNRFLCSVAVVIGGVSGSGLPATVTLDLHTGNITPNCPDDPPSSPIVYTATKNFTLINGPGTVRFDIEPPILVGEDFLWVCLTSTNNDAAWGIAGRAETGSTLDSFLIPNGNGTCGGGDYFFFGGNPYAGFAIEIKANPGPPGACCNRDVDPAVCTDAVLRANCVNNIVNFWKEGLCADFGNTNPICTACLTVAGACSGATADAEVNCSPGYQDTYNNGCFTGANVAGSVNFNTIITCGQSICGTAGDFQAYCTQDASCGSGGTCNLGGNFCQGETTARDQDWYKLTLTQDTDVTWTVTARFPFEISLMNNGGDGQTCTGATRQIVAGKACETKIITECLPDGDWWLRFRPGTFVGVPCDAKYRVSVACGACSLPHGACCDATPAGCTERAEKGCTPRGGTYKGDGTTCAVEGASCPGIPPNNDCPNHIDLTALCVMKTFDTSFATDTDLDSAAPNPDVPPTCSIGAPSGTQPAMREDIFYTYKIPTNYQGLTMSTAVLVISTVGSSFDAFVAVYGDTGAAITDCNGLCSQPQIVCNNDILRITTNPFALNMVSHINLDISTGDPDTFGFGECILIRVGTPTANAGGPGQLNIDLIPTSPGPNFNADPVAGTGRCCFWDANTQTASCMTASSESTCVSVGGYHRKLTDFYDGSTISFEQTAGCCSDPCPGAGDACYTAIALNAALGGSSGTITRAIRDVFYMAYVVPSGVNGLVIDGCGSSGFFDPQIAVYTTLNTDSGDCNLGSLIVTNDDCQVTQTTAGPALQVASCFGGLNATSAPCLCVPVNAAGGPQMGQTIYIAYGGHQIFNGLQVFQGSTRDVIDPVPNDLGGPVNMVLNVNAVAQCFSCVAPCPGGSTNEGEAICEDTNNPGTVDAIGPQDLYDGGCFSTPPTFNGPTITCSTTPIRICGKAGNFTNPYPCDSSADCPGSLACTGAGGSCSGTPYFNRDTDWYRVVVSTPSVIRWKVTSAEFAPEIGIVADVAGDCSNAFFLAFDDLSFPCEPPTGTTNTLEVTASVCGTPANSDLSYYLYIAPSVFGGLGEASCDSNYVAEVSCEPFVQLADCCVGDMNNDGKVNGGDIRKWIDTLFFPPTRFDEFQGCFAPNLCRADTSGNGLIDPVNDLNTFVNLLVQSNKPTCPTATVDCFDPAFGQPPGPLESGEVGAVMSDLDLTNDFRAADCFCPSENGQISSLCWWGAYVAFSGSNCGPEPDCFQVTFYAKDNGECPGTRISPPGSQYLATVVRTATGGTLSPTGVPTDPSADEFIYTATLPIPMTVTAGQCLWLEIVNNTPPGTGGSDCKWFWETSPFGDTRHAEIDITPATGDLPTVYTSCTDANHPAIDMAFNVGVHIDKEGCGKPTGRCCYDAAPLGVIDCIVTTLERCQALFFGEWVVGGSCPPSPACILGRCCYADLANAPQCVITLQSTCNNLDQTSPQISTRPGLFTAGISSCGTSPCPTGRCCVGNPPACTAGVTEAVCLAQGGAWLSGGNCAATPPCPSAICDVNSRCQLPHVVANVQQGGYVSDADNATFMADDFRPSGNGTVNQICWRGFHSSNGCDGGVGSAETFNVKFYKAVAGNSLPDLTQVVGTYTGQTPTKSIPVPNEASSLGSQQYKYELFLSPTLAVSSGQCYWLEIQNTTVNASCVWLWATAAPSDSPNKRAAIRNTGGSAFTYQNVDRDQAFCVGPVVIGATACSYTPPAPSNNACASAITILSNTPTIGTLIGSTIDGSASISASCSTISANGGDVWYRYTSNAFDQTLTVSTCGIRTTFDSMVSIHKTMPDVPVECPGSSSTIVLVGQSCDDEGCTSGLGTQQLFFPNKQGRRVSNTNAIDPNKTYIIRINGKDTTPHSGGSKGVFTLTVTQP